MQLPSRIVLVHTRLAFGLAIAALALTASPALEAQKGKPGVTPNAVGSVTLADRTGADGLLSDELTSDLAGAYEGAVIYGPSGDLRLDLATPVAREMVIALEPENLVSQSSANDVVPGTYHTDAVFYVQSMAKSPTTGAWMRTVGRIGFGSALPDHALGFRYNTSGGVTIYGTELCVRRVPGAVPSTWQVASSDACSGDEGRAGLFRENLKGKNSQLSKAVYKVRFAATVVCTSGSTCPQ